MTKLNYRQFDDFIKSETKEIQRYEQQKAKLEQIEKILDPLTIKILNSSMQEYLTGRDWIGLLKTINEIDIIIKQHLFNSKVEETINE